MPIEVFSLILLLAIVIIVPFVIWVICKVDCREYPIEDDYDPRNDLVKTGGERE